MPDLLTKRLHPSRRGWWTTGDLASLFGTGVNTPSRWLRGGTLNVPTFVTPGGRTLVRHGALMGFLRSDPQYAALIPIAEPDAAPAAHAGR